MCSKFIKSLSILLLLSTAVGHAMVPPSDEHKNARQPIDQADECGICMNTAGEMDAANRVRTKCCSQFICKPCANTQSLCPVCRRTPFYTVMPSAVPVAHAPAANAVAHSPAANPEQKFCGMCANPKLSEDFKMLTCGHDYCIACLMGALCNRLTNDGSVYNIVGLCHDCRLPLNGDDVNAVLANQNEDVAFALKEQFKNLIAQKNAHNHSYSNPAPLSQQLQESGIQYFEYNRPVSTMVIKITAQQLLGRALSPREFVAVVNAAQVMGIPLDATDNATTVINMVIGNDEARPNSNAPHNVSARQHSGSSLNDIYNVLAPLSPLERFVRDTALEFLQINLDRQFIKQIIDKANQRHLPLNNADDIRDIMNLISHNPDEPANTLVGALAGPQVMNVSGVDAENFVMKTAFQCFNMLVSNIVAAQIIDAANQRGLPLNNAEDLRRVMIAMGFFRS